MRVVRIAHLSGRARIRTKPAFLFLLSTHFTHSIGRRLARACFVFLTAIQLESFQTEDSLEDFIVVALLDQFKRGDMSV